MSGSPTAGKIGVVIATRNRRERLTATLKEMERTDPDVPVVVVDNASTDGTLDAARSLGAETIRLEQNRGAGARNIGAARLETEYVAFNDDDSWWSAGSLRRAVRVLDENPDLALLAARVVVGRNGPVDPVCREMEASPIPASLEPLPPAWQADRPRPSERADGDRWPGVVGFVACGAVVRRKRFLDTGGFEERLGVGGEEEVLSLDLWSAGFGLAYVDEVEAVHEPVPGPRPGRIRTTLRNRVWAAWLRRPRRAALRQTIAVLRENGGLLAVLEALGGLRWVLRERRVVPNRVESMLRLVETETTQTRTREAGT